MFHKIVQTEMRCTSILVDMPARDYLDLVRQIYREEQGGIAGQRAVLKTKTAKPLGSEWIVEARSAGEFN